MRNTDLIRFCIFFVLFLFTHTGYTSDKTAPSFALFSTAGNLVKLSAEIEKNEVLLVFFAGYCVPCREEIPELIRIHEKYPDRFKILFINIDKEGKPEAERTLGGLGVKNYTCLLDLYQQTVKKYSPALAIPAFFLIDKSGRIRYQSISYKSGNIAAFENYIKKNR